MPTPPRTNARTRRAAGMRQRYGTQITFRSTTWSVGTKPVSSTDASSSGLLKDPVGFEIVGADTRVFVFGAMDFTPYTAALAPKESELITWHGETYVISEVNFSDVQGDTHAINAMAFRRPN